MKKLALVILSCSVMIFINGCGAHWGLQNSRAKISSEWEMLDFLLSDENINKRNEMYDCREKGDDSTQCDKILDTYRESCARGEEKYCIGALFIHLDLYIISLIDTPKQKSDNSKIDEYLTLLKQNCNKGMANSCHAIGEFYGKLYSNLYLEMSSGKEEPHKEQQMLNNALLYLQKSCDLGMAKSCMFIANIYNDEYLQDTKQVKIYTDKARRILDRDCKAGVEMACDFKKNLLD